jgi:hypothetical protein
LERFCEATNLYFESNPPYAEWAKRCPWKPVLIEEMETYLGVLVWIVLHPGQETSSFGKTAPAGGLLCTYQRSNWVHPVALD